MRIPLQVANAAVLIGLTLCFAGTARAGFLDKLNAAAQKVQGATQSSQQSGSGGGSLSAGLGATKLEGLNDFNTCMAQTSGAHEKLTAQVLQRKLNHQTVSAQQRRAIEQDITWLNAKAAGQQSPAPDPKNPQRYLLELADEEQVEINSAVNQYSDTVREKCEAQYGGMSQFSDPSGRRRAPIDTRVPFPDLLNASPPAAQLNAAEAQKDCMAGMTGLRWQIMAEHMERKLQSMPNLSVKERRAWEEDIAVVRQAQQNNAAAMPQSPDPQNPMRYMTRLTPQDQMAMAQEQSSRAQQLMAGCSGVSADAGRGSELQAMHAQRRAERDAAKNLDPNAAQAQAQAWLDARPFKLRAHRGSATQAEYLEKSGTMECYDRQKGFRAHQTAERLSEKRATVAAQDREELETWITAWRAAEQAGKDEPAPVKGKNPQGWLRFLSGPDQQELNMAYSALHNKITAECGAIDHMEVGRR